MTTTTQDLINAALRGEPTPEGCRISVYWDERDAGPAYRVHFPDGREETGPLQFRSWAFAGEESGTDGYHPSYYFGGDGEYLGPDTDGVYPALVA